MQLSKLRPVGIALIALSVLQLRSATTVSKDDAYTTCLILARLTAIATEQAKGNDALVLRNAYQIAKGFADANAIVKVDEYMNAWTKSNIAIVNAPITVGGGGFKNQVGGGGFTNMTINELAGRIATDSDHKTAVIVVGKDGTFQAFHFTTTTQDVTNVLKSNGALAVGKNVR